MSQLVPIKNNAGKNIAWRLDAPGMKSQIFYRQSTAIREMTRLAKGTENMEVTAWDVKLAIQQGIVGVDGRKDFRLEIKGRVFSGRLIKRFVSTLPEGWGAYIDDEQINFYWTNGKAHINSINKAIMLSNQKETK